MYYILNIQSVRDPASRFVVAGKSHSSHRSASLKENSAQALFSESSMRFLFPADYFSLDLRRNAGIGHGSLSIFIHCILNIQSVRDPASRYFPDRKKSGKYNAPAQKTTKPEAVLVLLYAFCPLGCCASVIIEYGQHNHAKGLF